MIIQTLEKAYEVIQRIEEREERSVYLCRLSGEVPERFFLVTAFLSDLLPRESLIYFLELSVRQDIEDLEECFLKNGFLYLVFQYEEAPSLSERLSAERFPIGERLAIARSLMDQVVGKNLPPYLLYEALAEENVRAGGDGGVRFFYQLREPERLGEELFPEICGRIAGFIERIFAKELSGGTAEPLKKWLEGLRAGRFHNLPEVYRRYKAVDEWMRGRELSDGLKPDSFFMKLWRKLQPVFKWLKRLVFAAILIALLVYLIYSALYPSENGTPVSFRQIGEISLESEAEESGAEASAEEVSP